MSSLFEDVCARRVQLKQIWGARVTERSWHAASLHPLGQPFASAIALEPHGKPLRMVLLAALPSGENRLGTQGSFVLR